MNIGVIDIGFGNVGSVINILKRVGAKAYTITSAEDLNDAEHLILPGVGNFDSCVNLLKSNDEFYNLLHHKVQIQKIPFLGICIGMQLLFKNSEEGSTNGLGWVEGTVRGFKFRDTKIKVPHMGWDTIQPTDSGLLYFDIESRFYFVHSFFVDSVNRQHVLSYSTYHEQHFVSAVKFENIMGVQFHPEKSHVYGMKFFKQYLKEFNDG